MEKSTAKTRATRKPVRQTNSAGLGQGRWMIRLILHPLVAMLASGVGLTLAAIGLWNHFSPQFLNPADYVLSLEKIDLTPPNRWVPEPPGQRLVSQLASEKLTLLSRNLVEVAASRTAQLPYVDSVRRVEKSAKGLRIEAVYREPVGAVEMGMGQLLRLDRQAIQIGVPTSLADPSDDWLRINVHLPRLELAEWSPIGDPRIEAAARICHELRNDWRALGLYRVVFYWPAGTAVTSDTPFEVWTANGSRILWCNGGDDRAATAAQKIEALKNWIAVNGSLEKLAGWRMIDVRSGQVLLVSETRASFNLDEAFLPY